MHLVRIKFDIGLSRNMGPARNPVNPTMKKDKRADCNGLRVYGLNFSVTNGC